MTPNRLGLVFAVLLTGAPAGAEVTGRVTSITLQPLEGVQIQVRSKNQLRSVHAAVTNANGQFAFDLKQVFPDAADRDKDALNLLLVRSDGAQTLKLTKEASFSNRSRFDATVDVKWPGAVAQDMLSRFDACRSQDGRSIFLVKFNCPAIGGSTDEEVCQLLKERLFDSIDRYLEGLGFSEAIGVKWLRCDANIDRTDTEYVRNAVAATNALALAFSTASLQSSDLRLESRYLSMAQGRYVQIKDTIDLNDPSFNELWGVLTALALLTKRLNAVPPGSTTGLGPLRDALSDVKNSLRPDIDPHAYNEIQQTITWIENRLGR